MSAWNKLTQKDECLQGITKKCPLLQKVDMSWNNVISKSASALHDVAYGNSQFAAVGVNGTIQTSSDGTSWTLNNTGVTTQFNGITYGNSIWVIVGVSGNIHTSDGETLTSRTSGTTVPLNRVIYKE